MKPMSIMMKEFSLQTVELAAPPHPSVDLSEGVHSIPEGDAKDCQLTLLDSYSVKVV